MRTPNNREAIIIDFFESKQTIESIFFASIMTAMDIASRMIIIKPPPKTNKSFIASIKLMTEKPGVILPKEIKKYIKKSYEHEVLKTKAKYNLTEKRGYKNG